MYEQLKMMHCVHDGLDLMMAVKTTTLFCQCYLLTYFVSKMQFEKRSSVGLIYAIRATLIVFALIDLSLHRSAIFSHSSHKEPLALCISVTEIDALFTLVPSKGAFGDLLQSLTRSRVSKTCRLEPRAHSKSLTKYYEKICTDTSDHVRLVAQGTFEESRLKSDQK